MARRGGRSRKVGLKRIDAAIDNLTPMGFLPEIIRRNVDRLLNLYGEEGWPFIEEAAYKLLIEFILEEEEEEVPREQGEPSFKDFSNEDGRQGGGEAESVEAGPSSEASEPLCSKQLLKPSSSPTKNVTSLRKIAFTNEVNQTDDILIDQEKIVAFSSIYALPGAPGLEHILREKIAPSKRKPCLGWIGHKDDEDYILLVPAPVLGLRTGERQRKRKSRWDVKPFDVV